MPAKPNGIVSANDPERQQEVLQAMIWLGFQFGGHTPEVVARCLSLHRRSDCDWCPLKPLGKRQPCRVVPATSREAVRQVLLTLHAAGLVRNFRGSSNVLLWEVVEAATSTLRAA